MDKLKEELDRCLNCKTKPCQLGCPLGNDIPTIIQLVKDNKIEEAYDVLTQTTVLSSVCGRVCPHMKQCKKTCTRGIKSEPIDIGGIEAWISDYAMKNNFKIKSISNDSNLKDRKVAIVGGGPAGLTCAAFLARNGVNVTIYEKHDKLGGLLYHGIPDFRLDRKILDSTINRILDLGVKVEYNKELGKNIQLDSLANKYDAVFLGFGANVSSRMNIPGENLKDVYGANELLEYGDKEINFTGKKIAVIGGGNVAMDIARTVNKKNPNSVTIIYRRAEQQMPAEQKEIQAAKDEGVKFLLQNNITAINGNKEGQITNIECIKTKLVKKEGESREVPVNIENSNYNLDMDMVIMAVGSKTEFDLLNRLDLKLDKYNCVVIDENGMTSKEKVFAGGELAGERATVAWAAKSGRDQANNIIKYLKKEDKQ